MNLFGIQFRLLLLGIVPSLLLVSSLAFYFIQYHYIDLENALKDKGQVTINQLAISSIYGVFSANTEVLNEITKGLLNEPDIVSVHIIDNLGNTLVKSEQKPLPPKDELLHFQHPVVIHAISNNLDESFITPLQTNQSTSAKIIGSVNITLSLENTNKQQHDYLLNSLLIIFIGVNFSIVLAMILSKNMSLPIINLTKVANALADGKMDTRAVGSSIFEVDALCKSFNSMAIGLQQTQNYLVHQVDRAMSELNLTLTHLEERNKSLEHSSQLATAQNKAKSQFIAHISHEIRTPMNGVLGFIELLSKSKLSSEQLEQTLLIKQSATYLLTIINEILDYSSLETGNFKINTSTFNFIENIENCTMPIVPSSDKVQLIIDIDNNIPLLISTDPIRLQQIIANFLGNAIKFTQQGHIIVRCRLLKNSHLFISVSDTGIGIHANEIDFLFEPFLQFNDGGKENSSTPGSGLGLTICKNIANRLGGNLGVCSIPKIGSTFWINLPISPVPNIRPTLQQKSIVVIDPFNLRKTAFIKQLYNLGYKATGINNFSEFEQHHQNNHFDVIFYASINNDFKSITKQLNSISTANVIFLSSIKQAVTTKNILYLPCRSSFLKATIENIYQSQHIPIENNLQSNSTASFSIFIADDNKINRLLLKSQLERYCKNITLSSDGKEALSYLHHHKYDLILLDLQMPYFSGQEIVQIIKQPGEINRNTPTIAVTAHAQSNQRKSLIDAGFDECLIKPVLLEQLVGIIDLWLPDQSQYFTASSNTIDYVSAMLEKTSNNYVLASTLFDKLFLELPEQTQKIKQAIDIQNIALAEQITHKLHGSVSFCGFSEMQQIAHDLENSLINRDLTQIHLYFSQLEDKTDHFFKLKTTIISQLKKQ